MCWAGVLECVWILILVRLRIRRTGAGGRTLGAFGDDEPMELESGLLDAHYCARALRPAESGPNRSQTGAGLQKFRCKTLELDS